MRSRLKFYVYLMAAISAALLLGAWSLQNIRRDWPARLAGNLDALESKYQGEYGVYVIDLSAQISVAYKADKSWYLAGLVDVCNASAFLKQVELGRTRLDQEVLIRRADITNEANILAPSSSVPAHELIRLSVVDGNQTAADILTRKAGAANVGEFCRQHIHELKRFSDHKTGRRDAYGELHRQAKGLSNWDFIELERLGNQDKLNVLARKIYVGRSFLRVASVREAYERYYRHEINSASLEAFGRFMQRLTSGQILNREHTGLITEWLQQNQRPNLYPGRACGWKVRPGLLAVVCFKSAAEIDLAEAWASGLELVDRQF